MDQLADALKFVANLQAQALTPREFNATPRSKQFVVGTQILEASAPPPPRTHRVDSVAEVVAVANRFKGEGESPVVWYDDCSLVVVIDDPGLRVEMASLQLELSDLFLVLASLRRAKECWKVQKDFVRMLRIDLAGTLDPGQLLDIVRSIKIENGSTVTSTVMKGKESMGHSLSSSAVTEKDLPDEVLLEVPVYKTAGESHLRFSFRCTVECDPTQLACFRLLPVPDEVERVRQLAVESIGARLAEGLEEGIPSYQGRP